MDGPLTSSYKQRAKIILVILSSIILYGCAQDTEPQAIAAPLQSVYHLYMPSIIKSTYDKTNVGVETESSLHTVGRYYNPNTRLKISIRGDLVITPTGYDWHIPDNKLHGYYADWITVKQRPPWMGSGDICNLPLKGYWWQYAKFVQAIINRYQPEYIEIWNEPDAVSTIYPELLGCVGDGKLYGQFVDYIYENVTGATIIMGAVSNIYDPFINDALEAAGSSVDGISFHCYEHYWDRLLDGCKPRYEYAKTLDNRNRPVYLSETAVLWKRGSEAGYEKAQIKHYRRLKELPTPWYWYTLCGNGWPVEMPTDMCRRPVEDLYAQE